MAIKLKFNPDGPGTSGGYIMYYQPTRLEGLRCSRGILCNYGICDECQRTHRQSDESEESDEIQESDDDSCNNNTNMHDIISI